MKNNTMQVTPQATVYSFDIPLMTTDSDFDQLDKTLFIVIKVL